MRVQRTDGNIFEDLGFSPRQAENLRMRSELMVRLGELIRGRGLRQAEAAKLFGVSQPRVSDLVRGRIDRFSIDTLIKLRGKTGVEVRVTVRTKSRAA